MRVFYVSTDYVDKYMIFGHRVGLEDCKVGPHAYVARAGWAG